MFHNTTNISILVGVPFKEINFQKLQVWKNDFVTIFSDS